MPDGSIELRDTEYGFLDYRDLSDVATVIDEAPVEESATPFALLPNYPNPFDQSTIIPYTLAATAPVRLVVYNSLGQTVRTLVDDDQSAGRQDVVWNGQDESGQPVANGLYLYRLEIPEHYSANGKMMLPGFGNGAAFHPRLDPAVSRTRLVAGGHRTDQGASFRLRIRR